jgi:hypothetical protein
VLSLEHQNPSKVRMSPRQIWIQLLGPSVKDPNGIRLFAKDKHMRPETMQSPGAAPAVLTMAIQSPSERRPDTFARKRIAG